MNKLLRNTSGYTLIEILVVISIMGILFGLGYANYRDYSRRQGLINTKELVLADLRLAQATALSGTVPSDFNCTGSNFLNGYDFRIRSSTRYEIRANCSGGYVSRVTKNVYLPSGTRFVNPYPAPNPILFKVLGQGTNISAASTTITLTQTGVSNNATITIYKSGRIE